MLAFFKKLSISGIILVIVGLGVAGYMVHARIISNQIEDKMQKQYMEDLKKKANHPPIKMGNDAPTAMNSNQNANYPNPAPSTWDGTSDNPKAFARIIIPKIQLVAPVVDGTEPENIKLAIGHVIGTKMPGQMGNTAFAGHRSYSYGKFFHRLGELEPYDKIIIEDKKLEYTYVVTDIFKVYPDEVWVNDDIPGKETLTLITCEPLYGNTYRLIVRGVLERK